jgi:hypothetical protein
MMNRFTMLLTFLAAFTLTTPAFAGQPETDAKEAAADDAKADDSKAPDAKADDAKADDAKAEEKADDAKADDAKTGDGDAKADDPAEGLETDEEAVEAAKGLIVAIHQKHWALALGLGLSLLVFGLRKVKVLAKVPKKALPWVTAVLGVVGYIAVALTVEGADIMDAVWGGAVTGAAAVGLWEMVLKNFLGSKGAGGSGG